MWVCNEYSNLHHMGFWSEKLTGDSTHFATSQCPLEICGRDGGVSPTTFAYHRDPLGIRFELVDVRDQTDDGGYAVQAGAGMIG